MPFNKYMHCKQICLEISKHLDSHKCDRYLTHTNVIDNNQNYQISLFHDCIKSLYYI